MLLITKKAVLILRVKIRSAEAPVGNKRFGADDELTMSGDGSVQTKEGAETALQAAEAHEGESQKTCRDEDDARALHSLRNLHQFELLAKTGEKRHCQGEADGRGDGIDDALQEVEVFLDDEDGYAEYVTVGGNQRQEDAQCLIQSGRHLFSR